MPRTDFLIRPENPVEKIFWGRLPINHASAFLYFRKTGLTQRLIHQLKYKQNTEIGHKLGYMFGIDMLPELKKMGVEGIAVVPLHPKKIKVRGYNQSEIIAKGFCEATGINFIPDLLKRKFLSETQTRKKRFQRWENMENIFEIEHPNQIEGKHILLLDDVITTGATLEACGKEILAINNTALSMMGLCLTVH